MRKAFLFGLLASFLVACCPTPQGALQQATAFVGEVVTVSPDRLELRLTSAQRPLVPVLLQDQARILNATGNSVLLTTVAQGERVSVSGFLDAANTVIASEIRVLGPRLTTP